MLQSSPPSKAHSGYTQTRRNPALTAAGSLGDEPALEDRRRLGPSVQLGRRPTSVDLAARGAVASRLGPRAIDDTDARHRLDRLALSQ